MSHLSWARRSPDARRQLRTRGVLVEDEQGAESRQQQADPVAWLAPGDQQPENGNQDPQQREGVDGLASQDADRHRQGDKDQHHRAKHEGRRPRPSHGAHATPGSFRERYRWRTRDQGLR